MRFGKNVMLSPRFVGPYEIVKRIGKVTYLLNLPTDMSSIHDVYHVLMLKKFVLAPTHVIKPQVIGMQEDLNYEEKSVEILRSKNKDSKEQINVEAKIK